MPTKSYQRGVSEVFGYPPPAHSSEVQAVWNKRECPFLGIRCPKPSQHRDYDPEVPFGACSVWHRGKGMAEPHPYVICPIRFVQDRRVFLDASRLLPQRDGTEIIVVPEMTLPIGRIDYIIAQYDREQDAVVDFVVLEIMACSTTGTGHVLRSFHGYLKGQPTQAHLEYGINFRQVLSRMMIQVLAKAYACEKWNKRMVWVIQDVLYHYIQTATKVDLQPISFDTLEGGRTKVPQILFFTYRMAMDKKQERFQLELAKVYGATKEDFTKMILEPRTIPEIEMLVGLIERKIRNGETTFNLHTTSLAEALGGIAAEIVSEPLDDQQGER